ncbi:MAG: transcriptional regulator, AraC family [Bacteroidetes bacterium]|nr:transcriptional regulator, AraC family [Bacteroidota bacterium]
MNNLVYILLTNALAAACMVFAIIFITFPIPQKEGLKNYRISLRFLFVAYAISALIAVFDKILVNVLSMIFLSMCSFLILLFSIALINLLHPERITRKFILLHFFPLLAINMVYWLIAIKAGNPRLTDLTQVIGNISHFPVLIRVMTWLACIVQLAYFACIFQRESALYKNRLNECFSENYQLNLPWVRLCYYGAIALGVYALIIALVPSPIALMTFFSVLAVFFIVFGVCYIQYPRTYVKVETAFHPLMQEAKRMPKRRYSWPQLREQVIARKYYMTPGINIEEIAQSLKIGRTTLSGFINKEEGMNFNSWIGTLRVEEAIRLFHEDPQLTITQVSEMVGYSEPSNFSRQFKSVTGISPSEWYRQEQKPA